ncbi:purine-cytosine permease family protein [Gluconobacter potus]|uniref:purine-cytosine permease family protein n=1 Tax=Gluconobacter potus TaxID=2724927 RepID=UPI0039E763F3
MTEQVRRAEFHQSVEVHTIYRIPTEHRHGRVRDLFTVWFSTNMTLLTIVTGALGPKIFDLSLIWAIVAVIAGNLVGAVFMALHAAQGPVLGVPQMVQSRGQFGVWGAVPIIVLVVLMYIGFAASNCVVGGEALDDALPLLGRVPAVLLLAFISLVPCILGYGAIHACSKAVTWLSGIAVMYCLVVGFWHMPVALLTELHGSVAGFCGMFSIAALWQIAYAPYVSDSSRYLPEDSLSVRNTFWASYGGTVLGTILPMVLGSFLVLQWPGESVVQSLGHLAGAWSAPVLVVLSVSIALANAMSVYCGALSSITIIQTFLPEWRAALRSRVVLTCALLGLSLFFALGMADTFMKSYAAFLDILMAVMVPWTAINLYDYYVLRHGDYDVDSFFRKDGGIYGYVNWAAVGSYVLGVLVEIPFLKNEFFTGFFVPYLHKVDVSWLVSLVVTSLFYAAVSRRSSVGDVSRPSSC